MRQWKAPSSVIGVAGQSVIRARDLVLDTVFPPQSLLTGRAVTADDMEGELWSAVNFLDNPCCAACGFPFEFDEGRNALCGRCAARRPAYDRMRSAMHYDDSSRKLVLDFKHGGRTAGLNVFAGHMRRAGREFLPRADLIIPVHLHPARLRSRRYNQSAILARAIDKRRFDPDILVRVKNTQTQGGKTHSGRRSNVSGAFAIRQSAKPGLEGKRAVLIDDVFTTGATLESCARALRKGGAKSVDAITLARVVKAQSLPT